MLPIASGASTINKEISPCRMSLIVPLIPLESRDSAKSFRSRGVTLIAIFLPSYVAAKMRESASFIRQHRRGAGRASFSEGRRPHRAGTKHCRSRGMVVVRPAGTTGNYTRDMHKLSIRIRPEQEV